MADDPTKRGMQDRHQVAGGQEHEIRYLAQQHGLSEEETAALIEKVGNDRTKLGAAVEEMTARQGP